MQTLYKLLKLLAVLWPILVLAGITLIGLLIFIKKEEGTLNPVALLKSLRSQLQTQHHSNHLSQIQHPPVTSHQSPVTPIGICKVCGCTEDNACNHPFHGPCYWVDDNTKDLCSHCGHLNDPSVERLSPKLRAKNLKILSSLKSL